MTQTSRNFGASLGMAVLGTVLILREKANIESSLGALGVPTRRADQIADALSHGGGGSGFAERAGSRAETLLATVQHDFALAVQAVFYVMAGVMLVAFLVDAGGHARRAGWRRRRASPRRSRVLTLLSPSRTPPSGVSVQCGLWAISQGWPSGSMTTAL